MLASTTTTQSIAQVVMAVPMAQCFDYTIPLDMGSTIEPGMRVRVSWGRRTVVAVVVAVVAHSEIDADRLKPITEVLDERPLLPADLLALSEWAAGYYHHPVGEVVMSALPPGLRTGGAAILPGQTFYVLSEDAASRTAEDYCRAPKQCEWWRYLKAQHKLLSTDRSVHGLSAAALKLMLAHGDIVEEKHVSKPWVPTWVAAAFVLSGAQQQAVAAINAAVGFSPFVLQGVTGSGKTEVYFQVIAQAIAQQRSALFIVPEIALTPQMVGRVQQRFGQGVALYHSGLSQRQRTQVWLQAAAGLLPIVIGTRSAVWLPMPSLAVIIIDESHDGSYKQQTGFRYSARDVALVRAKRLGCRIVLGTATPSLESLHQVQRGQHQLLQLPERVTATDCPPIQLVDCRALGRQRALAPLVEQRMRAILLAGQQVLVFLNRRGFATAYRCAACAWVAACGHCDAPCVLHQSPRVLWCHHCGRQQAVPKACPDCGFDELAALGMGTERLEEELAEMFPGVPMTRMDRDSTRAKGEMNARLEEIHSAGARIIVGTQMLAKGHHFPAVTLAVILHVDSALFSVDYRAIERLGQLMVQVAGRAGREQAGSVYCQTHFPDHPALQLLLKSGYMAFAQSLLAERQQAGLPPFTHVALVHASAVLTAAARDYLQGVKQALPVAWRGFCLGPVPSPMARRDGRYRWQLMCVVKDRRCLHAMVSHIRALLAQRPQRSVRVAVDIDPCDMA